MERKNMPHVSWHVDTDPHIFHVSSQLLHVHEATWSLVVHLHN